MEYDPRMIEAHNKTLAAYDRLIEILEDPSYTEDAKRARVENFYSHYCNYCEADDDIREINGKDDCVNCILTVSPLKDQGCHKGSAKATYNNARDIYYKPGDFTIEETIKAFRNRRNFLAQRAKENMEKDNG